jgi:hypothetical protein
MAVNLSVLRADRPLSSGRFLILISVRGLVDSLATASLKALDQVKNPMTSSGIERPYWSSARISLRCKGSFTPHAYRSVKTNVIQGIESDRHLTAYTYVRVKQGCWTDEQR